ncbi:MAG TPA: LytTR family DNA-binding domain-containing protein [Chitinophagaceae bacterium]|nr:LytTR family DNA-binding domain-containing protein [Chitinophagaceae bacterium]
MHDYFYVKDETRHIQVFFADVLYIEAKNKYALIVTTKEQYQILQPLQIIERALPGMLFCRIHRSFIISLSHTKWFDHNYAFVGECKIQIGKLYKDVLPHRVLMFNNEPNLIIRLSDYDMLNFFKKINPN